MSAETPVAGVLSDGTLFYAPTGEVVADGTRVTCHLCGRAFRSVATHLASHGWTKDRYCEAFGLERSQSLEGPETRQLRAASLVARLVFDPAIRQGSAAGQERARRGELARAAAAAARGRPFPEQRRRKAAQAARGAAVGLWARSAEANRQRARDHVTAIAADVARRHGYPDIQAFVMARTEAGDSLAAISRAAGLHKDWLSRHLGQLDPAVASLARRAAGSTARGCPSCAAWDSVTCPATCGTGTTPSTRPSTRSRPKPVSPRTASNPRWAATGWRSSGTPPSGTRPASGPTAWRPPSVTPPWPATSASAAPTAGRGTRSRRNPASRRPGCAGRPPPAEDTPSLTNGRRPGPFRGNS